MRKKLVLVGNGMAGVRTLEELLKLAPEAYDITVFGAEPHGNYNRILLSPVLAGEKRLDEIMLNDDAWYAANGITLHKGKTVTEIDRVHRLVIADDGTTASYDRLLLATGSLPVVLPIPGHDLPGVVTFRDIRDVDRMLEVALTHRHAVVIGGGQHQPNVFQDRKRCRRAVQRQCGPDDDLCLLSFQQRLAVDVGAEFPLGDGTHRFHSPPAASASALRNLSFPRKSSVPIRSLGTSRISAIAA